MKFILTGTKGLIELPDPKLKTEQDKEAMTLRSKYPNWRHSSLLLESGDLKILIDAGTDWAGEWQKLNPKAIVLTHLHPDHFFGIMENGTELPVYTHPRCLSTKEAKAIWKPRLFPDAHVSDKPFQIGPFTFTAIPVLHSVKFPTVAWLIESKDATLFYCPDYIGFRGAEDILTKVDYWIVDGSSLTKDLVRKGKTGDTEVYGHTSIKRTLALSEHHKVPHVIITHVGHHGLSWTDFQEKVKEMRADTIVGQDGLSFDIQTIEKLELERFRTEGIDQDLKHPKENWRKLLRGHQLLHIGWNRLKQNLQWGDWTREDIIQYHSKIIDALRQLYFAMIPSSNEI